MNAYSYLKALRHPDVVGTIREGKAGRVPHVEMILADLCQQGCKFCSYRLEGYAANQMFDEKRMMSGEKALEIIRDCGELGVQAIQFTGGGEPTLHSVFPEAIGLCRELGIKFSLVSNGVRITPELAELIVKGSWVRISLDAASEETYCSVRRVHKSHFEKAKAAIQYLRKERDETGHDCQIGVGFVVTPDNWTEVLASASLAQVLGADNFRISAQFSQHDEDLFKDFNVRATYLCAEAEKLSDEKFKVYNRFSDRLDDLRHHQPEDALCGYQFFTTYIGADLNVYRCCGYAYNERGLIGSIKDVRFKDFWMSQERFDNQLGFDARGCERCQFRRQNQALAYVLAPEKQLHEEFV